MRVLLVSPASHGGGAGGSGGIAGYVADLARELSSAGCVVGVVSAGHVYQAGMFGRGVGRCRAEEMDPVEGVCRFQVLNSPVLAPSLWQFGGPEDEALSRAVERAFGWVCRRFRPDVVHVHGFEGFSAGIVGVARRHGASVVFSVHNYHAFCPQVYLLRGRRSPCVDYEGGLACESCEASIDRISERRRRAGGAGSPPSIAPPERAPVMSFYETGEPTAETRALWAYEHPLWVPIEDGLPSAEASGRVAGRYGVRRRAFVDALNACGAVAAVSSAAAEICVRMGVSGSTTMTLPIGSWAAGVSDSERPAAPPEMLPLRLVFLGFGSYPKGLGVLCDALALLEVAYRRRVHLSAYGTGVDAELARVGEIRGDLAGVTFGGRYARSDVPGLLAGVHAVVVPSVWQDNGPQTAIEARALGVPVIGSRIGGIPDIVGDGVDGVLFRANDRVDLARVIAGLIRESGRLSELRGSVRPWITMGEHVSALVGLYGRVLSSRKARWGGPSRKDSEQG